MRQVAGRVGTRLGPALALAALAALPYLPALRGGLVWDDRMLIAEDGRFLDPHPVRELLAGDFFGKTEEPFRYGYYRPLTSLSYYLTWRAAREDPLPYHAANLGLHAAVTLAVWWLLGSIVPGRRWPPWLGAALFAVHPVHVENVAWIAGRTDILCALGVVPALALAWRHVHRDRPGRWPLVVGLVLLALGMLAKEMALLALPAFVLLALTDADRRRRWLVWAGAAAAVTGAIWAVRLGIAGVHPATRWTPGQIPRVLLTIPATFARYLGKLLLPLRAEPFMVNPLRRGLLDPLVLAGVAAALAAAWWAWTRRGRPDSVLTVLFLASFAPLTNLVRITAPSDMGAPMAERFLYLPSVFFCGLAALALAWLAERGRGARAAVACLAAVLVAAQAAAVWRRAPLWGDEERLFATMIRQAPDAVLPHTLLGTLRRRQHRWGEGERELRTALRLAEGRNDGTEISILNNLAGCVAAQGRLEKARDLLVRAGRLLAAATGGTGPSRASVEANRALVELAAGHRREAERHLRRALEADRTHREALLLLGRILAGTRPAEGEALLRRYLHRYGESPEALVALADAVGRQGRREAARELLARAAALRPGDPAAELPLGALELQAGRLDAAERAFRRVLERQPDNARALKGAAIACARRGRLDEARQLLARARRIAPGDAEAVLDLALVERTAGHTGRAAALARDAASMAPPGSPVASRAGRLLEELHGAGH